MKQGLLDFGADFEQDLDRAAKYVELNLSQLNAAIRRMKQGAKLGEKERAQAMRLGIDVSMSEGSEQLLQLLNDMKAKFEYIGSHPDLVASASMWDGKTDPDPVGQMIERAKREREAAEAENEMTDEEWMEKKAREEAAAMTPSLFAMTPSLSFSVSPTLRDDIRRAAYNKMDAKEHVRLCTMPTVLRMLGEPYGDIYTLPGTISKLVYTHNLAHPEVYRAVEELEDPLFVYRETGKTFVFVLEMEATNNKGVKSNVMAAIELERSGSGHYLMSAYPLDALSKIKDLQKQGRLVYSKYTAQELEEAINKQATPPTDNAPSPFKLGLMRSAVKDGLSEIVMTKQDIVKFNPPNFTASMTREQMDARSKRFNYRSENVSFNMEKNLAAVHSLSPEKFLAAIELGGMPMPSVAITRLDRPYEWGGASAINLIGRPEMVDPKKGTEVYGADAWTGKFPRITHKHIESEDFKEAAKAAGEMEDKYGYVFYDLAGKLRNADTREELRTLLSYDTGKALFAYLQGYRPKAKTAEKNRDYDFLDKQFVKDTKGMWENGESIKPGQEAAFADAVEASLERWLKGKSDKERKLYEGLYSELFDDLRNGRPYGVWFKLKMSMNNMGKLEPDAHANREMLAKYAERHKKEFAAWVKDKVDKWRSKEAYIRENGKEATLDNVVRLMLGKKGLNNEEFMGFNPGKLRAVLAAKMKSLDDIRARRDKLSGSQESKESKAASEELMMEYCRYVREYLKEAGVDSFNSIDYGLESLSLVKGKPNEEKVARALAKVFSYTKAGEAMVKDSEMLKKGVEAIEAIRNEIEDYMEAVPQRAVSMNEWEYAVLPKGLKKNKEVTDALKANGIKPIWHDGTEEGRKAALAGLVNEPSVSFQMSKYSNAERYMREAWAGDPRARLSGTSYNMEKNLAAVHSLSPEKFLAAVELGGMPMPSVAITRLDRPYEWGGAGAINLIGRPEMVDPKKRSKVYMHDAYTGTMPPVKYKRKNAAAAERLKQDALD
ncbi:MAG: hypothetical protein ACI4OX_04390, partial [Akkermansia sp.]